MRLNGQGTAAQRPTEHHDMSINPETPPHIEAYDVRTFCRAFSISRALLYQLWKAGQGPAHFKIGRRTLITRRAALAWLEDQERRGQDT